MNTIVDAEASFPRFRPVADHAVLVEFGDVIGRDIQNRVRQLDAALSSHQIIGVSETVPAYTSLLVGFDPLLTDHAAVESAINRVLIHEGSPFPAGRTRDVLICFDDAFAPDLEKVADMTGLSREEVIATHLSGEYSVSMYGFAPGYAYLAGIPDRIQLPRKPAAIRDVPAGSVIIAGQQCLITTLTMPTGWWIIGRSPTDILLQDGDRPFLFDVGDSVRFKRIDRQTFETEKRRG